MNSEVSHVEKASEVQGDNNEVRNLKLIQMDIIILSLFIRINCKPPTP